MIGLILYNLFLPLGFVFFLPELILKYRSRGGWKSTYRERFGFFGSRKDELAGFRNAIWIHAVSVGETVVAISMIRRHLQRFPEQKFIISTTTTTGQDVARNRCPENTAVIFCPLDFPWMVHRVFRMLRPAELVIFETEIWPNLISIAAAKKIPVLLVNARMSDHSAKGYRRFGKLFFSSLLRKFSLILTQSEADMQRFLSVSPRASVRVSGNMKFDQRIPELPEENILHGYLGAAPENVIIFGASTHPGEEDLIADNFISLKKEFPALKLVIVPRHAERGDDIAGMLTGRGLSFARRSDSGLPEKEVDVLLADTTGEMLQLMSGADVVIMGKSFAGHDEGHNLIEPALLGKPVVTGTTLRNFRYILKVLEENKAVFCCNDTELQPTLRRLISSAELREEFGARANRAINIHRGATDRTIDVLQACCRTDIAG
ncbi:MAG: 3-deoxy-D-manno-octulosonic acid transferase [Lentisphaerae bacterium]|nr:3-deoxy-D-manno-octulosonic acid transferase [Lentisphaerota bacterium]